MDNDKQAERKQQVKTLTNALGIAGLLSSSCFALWQENFGAGCFLLTLFIWLYIFAVLVLDEWKQGEKE